MLSIRKHKSLRKKKQEHHIQFQCCLPEIVSALYSLLVADWAQPLALLYKPALQDIFFLYANVTDYHGQMLRTQLQFQRHKKSLCHGLNHGHELLFKILNVVLITQKQVLKKSVTVIEAEPVTFALGLSRNQGLWSDRKGKHDFKPYTEPLSKLCD